MDRKKWILIAFCALMILSAVVSSLRRPEPVYEEIGTEFPEGSILVN